MTGGRASRRSHGRRQDEQRQPWQETSVSVRGITGDRMSKEGSPNRDRVSNSIHVTGRARRVLLRDRMGKDGLDSTEGE